MRPAQTVDEPTLGDELRDSGLLLGMLGVVVLLGFAILLVVGLAS